MKKIAFAAALLLAASPAAAEIGQPYYGGQLVMSGDWHVEVAVRDGAIRAWVRDHADKPLAAAGKATLLLGGKKLDLPLKAEGESLVAEAPVKAADKVAGILALTVGGKAGSVRFAQEAVVMPAALPKPLAESAKVFEQACAACHGQALRGTDAGPPLLHPNYAPGAGHPDDMLKASIAKGTQAHHWKFGDMPKPDIAPGQEEGLLAYIRTVQAANGIGPAPAAKPAPANPHAGMKH